MAKKGDKKLTELERLVARAADRIAALAAENADLKEQLKGAEASGKTSEEAWAKERAAVEKRVEDLVDRLSAVVDGAES